MIPLEYPSSHTFWRVYELCSMVTTAVGSFFLSGPDTAELKFASTGLTT